jgi:hypothetical protein
VSNFDAAQAKALFQAIQSMCQSTGLFQGDVGLHDPWNAPGNRLNCTISLGAIRPVPSSGLNSASGQVTLIVRVWSPLMQMPQDNVDPEVLAAACALMGKFAGGFTLAGTVRNIDLFGMNAIPAYVDFSGTPFKVVEITVPIVINDMWAEAA